MLFRARRGALLLLFACLALLAACTERPDPPAAVAGVLDLLRWDFRADGIASLDGQWQFAWERFEDPRQPGGAGATAVVPGTWTHPLDGSTDKGPFGWASYRLTVNCRAEAPLALSLPVQHSAVHWYVNGERVARQGDPAAQAAAARALPLQQEVVLPAAACPLAIVAHVSNFDLRRGGLLRSVELGDAQQVAERRDNARMRDVLAIGGLLVMGVMPLLFFLGLRKDRSPLYFGLFCLVFALGMGLTGTRVLQGVFAPFGWTVYLRVLFVCWYGTTVFYALFVRSLYPQDVRQRAMRAILAWGGISGLAVLFTPAHVFSFLLPTLAAGSILTGCYLAWRLAVLRRRGRRSAGWLLLALLVYAAAVLHDSFNFAHLARFTLLPYGVLAFVAAPAWLMARRFARALQLEERVAIEQRERADLLVRSTKAGLLDWDAISGRTTYSERYREMLGYASGPGAPPLPPFREQMHPDDRDWVHANFLQQLRERRVRSGVRMGDAADYRLLRADGDYLWVHAEAVAVCGGDGRTLRYICSFIDISQSKRDMTRLREQEEALRASHDQIATQAAQLERQNEALKENVRLREEVERIGRHDIKTPLNSIVAVPRLLREERRLGPEADELLGIVERAGYRILSMVNLSLDLYKMEQGSYIFRPDAVDLPDLVEKVLADVRVHAASKGVRFEVSVPAVPYAWAEELLCYSLLANLIKNAVEACPEGAVVRIRGEAGPDGSVLLHVHNPGAVPQAIRASFFQKYATLGKASGTGLGTYSARLMARVQDGDIAMRTSDNEGTTLTVTLRAAPAGVVPTSVRHASERGRAEPLQVAALPPTRVLLVDDDEYNLLIVRRFLPAPPFTVETAINGRMAIAVAQRGWPDVIFMDLDMPVMGGMQAVQELRALERARGAKRCTMIALSSHEDAATQAASLAAGFDRYLTKPVTRSVVHETLLQLVGAERALPAPTAPRAPAPRPAAADPVRVDVDMKPLMPEYLASRRALIEGLPAQLAAGEREQLRRVAHQLAGSFGLYGFTWASEQCRWVEKNFDAVDAEALVDLSARLQEHLATADIHFVSVD